MRQCKNSANWPLIILQGVPINTNLICNSSPCFIASCASSELVGIILLDWDRSLSSVFLPNRNHDGLSWSLRAESIYKASKQRFTFCRTPCISWHRLETRDSPGTWRGPWRCRRPSAGGSRLRGCSWWPAGASTQSGTLDSQQNRKRFLLRDSDSGLQGLNVDPAPRICGVVEC